MTRTKSKSRPSRLPEICSPGAGFTLVELIVTMVVVAIMAVAVVPRFSLLGGFDSRGMRDQTIAALRYAQKSAIAQRRHVCAIIAGNDITLRIATNFATTATCVDVASLDRELVFPADNCGTGDPRSLCRPTRVTVTLESGAILFDPTGRPISGADSYDVSDSDPIVVESETGYVH